MRSLPDQVSVSGGEIRRPSDLVRSPLNIFFIYGSDRTVETPSPTQPPVMSVRPSVPVITVPGSLPGTEASAYTRF